MDVTTITINESSYDFYFKRLDVNEHNNCVEYLITKNNKDPMNIIVYPTEDAVYVDCEIEFADHVLLPLSDVIKDFDECNIVKEELLNLSRRALYNYQKQHFLFTMEEAKSLSKEEILKLRQFTKHRIEKAMRWYSDQLCRKSKNELIRKSTYISQYHAVFEDLIYGIEEEGFNAQQLVAVNQLIDNHEDMELSFSKIIDRCHEGMSYLMPNDLYRSIKEELQRWVN